jgi:hypothetical protein
LFYFINRNMVSKENNLTCFLFAILV